MRIIKVKNYEEMSRVVADLIIADIKENPAMVLGLATGSTPIGAYGLLTEAYNNKEVDFSKVTTVNLDEYFGLAPENPQSYRYFMNEYLLNNININKEKTHVPNGIATDPSVESERYEKLIESLGGIDLQLLGMGNNGHIGFNEPCGEFASKTHHIKLTEKTITDNSRFFDNYEDVPKSAITMGIGTIMKARKLILAVSGSGKAEMLKKALFGPITPQIPASVLQLHNNVTAVVDCID